MFNFQYREHFRLISTALVLFFVCIPFTFFYSCGESTLPSEKEGRIERDSTPVPKEIASINLQLEKHPGSPFLYNARAKAWLKLKNLNAAIADIKHALSLDSTQAEVWMTQAEIYFITKKVREAVGVYENILQKNTKHTEANMKLAEIYLYVEDHKKSIQHLDNVLRLDVHNPKAYFLKGMNFKEVRDTAKAISSFQTTIEQDPGYYDAFMQLGILFSEKKDKMAVEYFNAATRIVPHSIEAFYGRAMFFQETGDYDKAIFDYGIITRMIDPDYKHAHYNTGYICLIYKQDYKKAAKHFTDAIRCDTAFVEAWYNRGLAFENLKDFQSARENYKKALQLNPRFELAAKALKGLK